MIKRREFLKKASYATAFAIVPAGTSHHLAHNDNPDEQLVYIGTYTDEGSQGIYFYRFNHNTGILSYVGVEKGVSNPSFLAISPDKNYLFAVNELSELAGQKSGGVSAFKINKNSGELHFLNQQASGGEDPCYLIVHRDGSYLITGNYSGGNFSVLPIFLDGKLGKAMQIIQHSGSSVNAGRQNAPHVHCVVFDPTGKNLIVTDLGTDKIFIYPFNDKNGVISESGLHFSASRPGAGPRHVTFSPDGKFLYIINELDSTIAAYKYNSIEGSLAEIQIISTLMPDYTGVNNCADIHIHPSGKFLYGSNRGHDSIVLFKRDQNTGILTVIDFTSTRGKTPRNFAIDPSGNYLIVANQKSNSIFTFRIDNHTGKLTVCEASIEIPSPVCIMFL
jgi:6-phosphogluconolactonase